MLKKQSKYEIYISQSKFFFFQIIKELLLQTSKVKQIFKLDHQYSKSLKSRQIFKIG